MGARGSTSHIPVGPAEDDAVLAAARAWLAEDPDPDTRAELSALLARPGSGQELRDRFTTRLAFGTAGLRGAMGAGPNRMNAAVVRFTTAGLAQWLLATVPDAPGRGVVIGFDARHKSEAFARDAARVLAGAGLRAHLFPRALPTPVLAFAVRLLGCAAGVMVTASHNPAADNGYKVYAGDGAQIAPPTDQQISEAIAGHTSLSEVPLSPDDDPMIERIGEEILEAYLAAAAATPLASGDRDVTLVYTAMHGVGHRVFAALLDRAGFPPPIVVPAQAAPDPDFPTVAFPNPEEPGALDLAMNLASESHAHLILANDPDADRLAVAIPEGEGWRRLTGDEVGALLASHLLEDVPAPDDRRPLVTTTVVSSRLLARIAEAAGAAYAETLTGFKWLVRPALAHRELRQVLAYEEALGYSVGELVRDKDGLTAGLVIAALAATERARGSSIGARLDELARRFGLHATAQASLRYEGAGARDRLTAVMRTLRRTPRREIADRGVVRTVDLLVDAYTPASSIAGVLPATDAVIFDLEGGARAVVRPSGTEPKLKVYLEVVEPVDAEADGAGVARVRARATAELERLETAMRGVLEG